MAPTESFFLHIGRILMIARRFLVGSAAALALAVVPASAQTIVVDNSSPFDASPGLTGYQTNFGDLGGMMVDWTFADGSTGSGVWGDLGFGFWGVDDSDFTLSGWGLLDTFFFDWSLRAKNLSSFTLHAAPGLAVFDIWTNPVGSPGSSNGAPMDIEGLNGCGFLCFASGDQWNTVATYSNPVGIGGAAPVGDLYATLNVAFGTTFGTPNCQFFGDCTDYDINFSQDMDNAPLGGSIGVPQETVPEPATMTLLATGLVGMAAARRRRKNIA